MAGAIQGIVMGILLWNNEKSPQFEANRFLAAILFFFSYLLMVETLYGLGQGGVNQWLYHILLEYNWIYGALIFFYVRKLLVPKWKLTRKDWIHFLPVGIEFLFSNFIKTQNFYWDGTRESLSWAGYYGYSLWMHTPFQMVVAIILLLFYAYKSFQLLEKTKHQETIIYNKNTIQRIRWTIISYLVFSSLALAAVSIDYLFFNYAFNPFHQYPTFIGLTLMTYWLGVQGIWYRNETVIEKTKKIAKGDKAMQAIVQKLEIVMKSEKLYLNPNLNVATLAKTINTKPYLLTKALNSQLSQKFNDYVNEFRVQEVIERINDEQYSNQTLLAIGYDSGFNSKASFNRIVKKITGKSPKELKK